MSHSLRSEAIPHIHNVHLESEAPHRGHSKNYLTPTRSSSRRISSMNSATPPGISLTPVETDIIPTQHHDDANVAPLLVNRRRGTSTRLQQPPFNSSLVDLPLFAPIEANAGSCRSLSLDPSSERDELFARLSLSESRSSLFDTVRSPSHTTSALKLILPALFARIFLQRAVAREVNQKHLAALRLSHAQSTFARKILPRMRALAVRRQIIRRALPRFCFRILQRQRVHAARRSMDKSLAPYFVNMSKVLRIQRFIRRAHNCRLAKIEALIRRAQQLYMASTSSPHRLLPVMLLRAEFGKVAPYSSALTRVRSKCEIRMQKELVRATLRSVCEMMAHFQNDDTWLM